MLKVILSGGGTSGHVNPAIAIYEIIKETHPDAEFLYVGTPNGIESALVKKEGISFSPIEIAGLQRKLTLNNIKRNAVAAKYLLQSGAKAKKVIESFQPDLVIGTGGYASEPIVHKAAQMGIKTIIHEQNAFPGVTTKVLAKKAEKIMLTVEKAKDYIKNKDKCVVTGLPVRSAFVKGRLSRAEAKRELGLDENTLCILSTGGSLGAGRINETVADLMAWYCREGINISHIHSHGKNGRGTFAAQLKANGIELSEHPNFIVREYLDNMPTCMEAADLIISRCGMGSLTEIEAVGCGSILVPSPIVAENHQYYNGKVLSDAGAAILYEQKDLTSKLLIDTVNELITDRERLRALSENAGKLYIKDTPARVAAVIEEVISERQK